MEKITAYFNFRRLRSLCTAALIAPLALVSGCSDDPDTEPGMRLGYYDEESRTIQAPVAGIDEQAIHYNLFSSASWELEVQYHYDEELDWVDLWPRSGKGDGRFRVKVAENKDTPYIRTADIIIIADGTPRDTIKVTQTPVAPRLELDMEGMTKLAFVSGSSEKEARLSTNVVWTAEILDEDATWVDFGEATAKTQTFTVTQNPGDSPRETTVRFYSKGLPQEITTDLTIIQRDKSGDPEYATKVTLADIFAYAGNGGEVQGNVYVEGYVISDVTSRNLNVTRSYDVTDPDGKFDPEFDYEGRLMYIMDETDHGVMVEFLSPAMNVFEVGTKIHLHLIDQTVLIDEKSGARKFGSVESDAVFYREATETGIEPVRLTSFDRLADYESCLVTIDPVQFTLPFGTYFNVDERYQSVQITAAAQVQAVPYGTTPRMYAHRLIDTNGNTVRLVTDCTFTERFIRLMPHGSGPITAIVTRDMVLDGATNQYNSEIQLRIRRDADNGVSEDASTRFSRKVVEFGPYVRDVTTMPRISDNIQDAQLKTSVYTTLGPDNSTIYWAYTYGRRAPSEIIVDESTGSQRPAVEQDSDNLPEFVYACLNATRFWRSDIGSSITDADGEAWIATFSTEGVTGDLWLSFTNSSSGSGPGSLDTEWSFDENTPVADWNPLGRHYIPNWDANYSLMQFSYKLPDEMKGHPNVVIRMRAVENLRASHNGSSIGSGGTNRVGLWIIEEKL